MGRSRSSQKCWIFRHPEIPHGRTMSHLQSGLPCKLPCAKTQDKLSVLWVFSGLLLGRPEGKDWGERRGLRGSRCAWMRGLYCRCPWYCSCPERLSQSNDSASPAGTRYSGAFPCAKNHLDLSNRYSAVNYCPGFWNE